MGFDVLLIGGAPGAGKTTLGRRIASEFGCSSMSVDDLVIAGRALTTELSHPALHQMRGTGHIEYFTHGPGERLIDDAIALEHAMWPAIERVISLHARERSQIVMDWWLFSPDRVATIDHEGVASLWIHIDDAVLEARERQNDGFFGASDQPDRMLANFMHRSLWRNELISSRALALNMPLIHQDGRRSTSQLATEAMASIRG